MGNPKRRQCSVCFIFERRIEQMFQSVTTTCIRQFRECNQCSIQFMSILWSSNKIISKKFFLHSLERKQNHCLIYWCNGFDRSIAFFDLRRWCHGWMFFSGAVFSSFACKCMCFQLASNTCNFGKFAWI